MPDETKANPDDQTTPATQPSDQAAPATQPGDSATTGQEPAAPALPEIEVAVEDAGLLKKKLTITVPEKRITAKMDEMFGELSDTAMVPGFRIGHAPRRLIEKRFGREVSHDVRNKLIGEALQPALEKSKIQPIGEPSLDLEKIQLPDKGDMSFSFEIEVAPEFTLPELAGIKVAKPTVAVTEERIDEQIEQWRLSQARFDATDGAADKGDVVAADATVAGEGVEPVKSDDLTLRVAPGQVQGLPLVDLGDALAGKKAGQEAIVKVKAPDAHPNEQWRGKELTVTIKVKTVRRRVLPDVNEQFAKSAGFESLADFRQFFGRNLEAHVAQETRKAMRSQVEQYLLDNTKLDVPEGVAARHTATVLQRRYIDLLYMGVPRERIDENLTQLQVQASEQALRELKLTFILGKIAQEQKLEVSEDEVNSRIAEIAKQNNRRPEKTKQELQAKGSLGQLEVSLLEEKVLDNLLAQAQVTEAAADEPKAQQAPSVSDTAPAKEAVVSAEATVEVADKAKPAEEAQPEAPAKEKHSKAPAQEHEAKTPAHKKHAKAPAHEDEPQAAAAEPKAHDDAAPAEGKKKKAPAKGKKKHEEDTHETA
jgi:trigger factor